MLSSLFSSLQSNFPKGFIFGSLIPTSSFALANLLMIYLFWPHVRNPVAGLDISKSSLLMLGVLVVLVVASSCISSLSSWMLELLEGKHLPPKLGEQLYAGQYAKLSRIRKRLDKATEAAILIHEGLRPTSGPGWIQQLDDAEAKGWASKQCAVTGPASLSSGVSLQGAGNVFVRLRRIEADAIRGKLIEVSDLRTIVEEFTEVLKVNSTDPSTVPRNAQREARLLSKSLITLKNCLGFSKDRYQVEQKRLYNIIQFDFPVDVLPGASNDDSFTVLAPSTMGNIGATFWSYSITRYSLDPTIFWSRIVKTIQTNSASYYGMIQDAKSQVDLVVALFWLNILFTCEWGMISLFKAKSPWLFLAIILVGLVLAFVTYYTACQAYRVFIDILRSSIDLFRFNLLSDLHISAPPSTAEENEIWNTLGNKIGFGDDGLIVYKPQ